MRTATADSIPTPPRLRPATTAHELVPGMSPAAFRWALFQREQNGLAAAVIRIGRRVYIDEAAFYRWLESKREAPAV